LKVFEDNAAHWGKDWIVIANPAYGSFESAPYGHDYKLPVEAQRAAKEKVLEPWQGP
jgi:predicted secreted acid phosphatase